ncbi:MAG: hypothetical protein HY201_04685 [Nitrospirae bacterium]|nr:hypothetical protein [Candidatus Troglogloeales bacterium]MBI3598725.1 hypothetical protein [Candidatus Troglogloeales bacterium]
MDSSAFIARSIKTSLIASAVLFVFLLQWVSLQVLWGGSLGIAMSVLNLFLLSRLSETLLNSYQKKKIIFYAALKLPIFYGLLIFLPYQFHFSVYGFMAGFSVPIFVIILKTVGATHAPPSNGEFIGERANIIRSA